MACRFCGAREVDGICQNHACCDNIRLAKIRELEAEQGAENRGAQARDENKSPVQASLFEMAKGDQGQPKRRSEVKRTAVRATPKTSANMGRDQSARRESENSRFASAQQSVQKNVTDFDTRKFVLQLREGDYLTGVESTKWETVKSFAKWSKDRKQALEIKGEDLQSIGYMELVCGFSGLKLVPA